MHVVFVTIGLATPDHSAGGLSSFMANMAHIFKEKGHHASVILTTTKEVNLNAEEGVDLYSLYVPMKKWIIMDKCAAILSFFNKKNRDEIRNAMVFKYKSWITKRTIQKIHKSNPIDIIHCSHHISVYGIKNIPYIVRVSSLGNYMKGANMPEYHLDYDEENPKSVMYMLKEKIIKKTRYLVAPSHLLSEFARKNLGVNVTVIESPFVFEKQNWDDSVLEQYSLNDKKYIMHYGSLRYLKGTHIVAKLAHRLLQKYPDLYLVLAGRSNDMLDEKGNTIKAHELVKHGAGEYADRVIYVGNLVREQLYPLVQNAELCLLPSRIENLSNACIESMAMGKIVVATNGASYEQLIDDKVNGFLCERDNPESFMHGIDAALSLSEEEKRIMGNRAMETTKRLSPDNIYEQYLSFYEKVIKEW